MSSLASLFSGSNFKRTIQNYCRQIGWNVARIDNNQAVLQFTMQSGRTQTLWIRRFESTIEFAVPSMAVFNDAQAIPHEFSTELLMRNANKRVGFWCVQACQGGLCYSYMHNAEIQLLSVELFGTIVAEVVNECEAFDDMVTRVSQPGPRW